MRKSVALVALALSWAAGAAEPVVLFDFTEGAQGWSVNHDATVLDTRPGLSARLHGIDPWFEGPWADVPSAGAARKLNVFVEAECSEQGPNRWELFYAPEGEAFSAGRMAYLVPDAGAAGRLMAVVREVSPKMRFRIDPPGTGGTATLRKISVAPMAPLAELAFEKPEPVAAHRKALRFEVGAVAVEHHPDRWNAMTLFVDGKKMAETNPSEWLMYHDGTKAVKVPLSGAKVRVSRPLFGSAKKGFSVTAKVRDEGGAEWTLTRHFSKGETWVDDADPSQMKIKLYPSYMRCEPGIKITTCVEVSEPRDVLHMPWLTLFSGVGTFGERKAQALVPGVEYLDDEPSSNEKEIRGRPANRRMVDSYKICYPMVALTAEGRWFSMAWQDQQGLVSAVFDSPDRVFNSGGHVMGLWSPGVGDAREENGFALYGGMPYPPFPRLYSHTVTLSGGKGETIVEAVKNEVGRRGNLPGLAWGGRLEGAVRLLASGWLDSKGREGTKFRHAVWGESFPAQPAQDVPAYMLWLASQAADGALRKRLTETAAEIVATFPKDAAGVDGISHVWRPTGAFVYGSLDALVQRAAPKARQIAEQLADGTATYTPAQGKPDYGSTLGAAHCNGFTAIPAEEMLRNATLTGDEEAIRAALAVLDKMTARYAGTVPRGAQPWEMPLHTPDILASARLVRCYVLGYLLSADDAYLEQARYWAWTGLAMVYLAPPVEGKVGLYATIGVIGATNWEAPNWIGQPVQWCGLVYRSALDDLARVDEQEGYLWRKVAQGITLAGVQMTFPIDDPQGRGGLLPDFYLLKQQVSDGPAINPGTLQAGLAEAFGKTPLYTATRLADGTLFHLPGEARQEGATLRVTTWAEGGYRALLTRIPSAPASVTWNGKPIEARFLADAKALIIPLNGSGVLEIVK